MNKQWDRPVMALKATSVLTGWRIPSILREAGDDAEILKHQYPDPRSFCKQTADTVLFQVGATRRMLRSTLRNTLRSTLGHTKTLNISWYLLYEKTAANLEQMLRHLREVLAETLVKRARKLVRTRKHFFKYGGDKWCSEFPRNQRPVTTTWPWSILPSLAVIWGVCWMFEMRKQADEWWRTSIAEDNRAVSSTANRMTPRHDSAGLASGLIIETASHASCASRANAAPASTLLPHQATPRSSQFFPRPSILHQAGSLNLKPPYLHHRGFDTGRQLATTSYAPVNTSPFWDSGAQFEHSSEAQLAAAVSQPIFALSSSIPEEPPTGAFYSSPYPAPPTGMNEDALAQQAAAAVLQGQAELAASVHSDGGADDSLLENGDPLDPFTPRRGNTHKREQPPPRNSEGKIVCRFQNTCAGLTFDRKCEWSKHMDKHERPYKCEEPGCEKLQGFTYSGGLLRHQREVHKMHGGTKEPLYCPFPNCKRNAGQGFTRKENRDEHIRRVHRRATDGTDLLGHKRDHSTLETTDPLLEASVLAAQEGATESISHETVEPQITPPPPVPVKRRRLQTNGNGILDNIDGDLEIKQAIKRLQESHSWLFKQYQQVQADNKRLSERLTQLEHDLGSHLISGACGIDTRMTDTS